jgi:hypothetical protein
MPAPPAVVVPECTPDYAVREKGFDKSWPRSRIKGCKTGDVTGFIKLPFGEAEQQRL